MQQNVRLIYGNHGHQMAHDRVPVLFVVICLFVLFVFVPSAFACSPAPSVANGEPVGPASEVHTLSEYIDASDFIVIGTVVKFEEYASVINVQNYLKGQGPSEIRVTGFVNKEPYTECSFPVSASAYPGDTGVFYISGNHITGLHPVQLQIGHAIDAANPVIIQKIKQRTGQQLTKPSKGLPLRTTAGIMLVASVCLVGIVFWYRKFKSKTR